MRRANATSKRARAIPCDIDELRVSGKLVEQRDKAFRLGELLVVVISLDLHHHVVHAKAVIAHGALKIGEIGFLAGQPFEKAQKFCRRRIERVVESGLVILSALFVAKSLFSPRFASRLCTSRSTP